MIWLIVATIALTLIAIPSGIAAANSPYDGMGWFLISMLTGMTACMCLIFVLVIGIERPVGRSSCAAWSRQVGVRTKFVLLNQFDTGTCLARTPNGRWILNSNWQAFTKVGK